FPATRQKKNPPRPQQAKAGRIKASFTSYRLGRKLSRHDGRHLRSRADRELYEEAGLGRRVELRCFLDVDRNRRPLRRRQVERAQVLAFRRRRLVADQRVDEGCEALVQLAGRERNLADGPLDDSGLVGTTPVLS